jgi:hypothetical protein
MCRELRSDNRRLLGAAFAATHDGAAISRIAMLCGDLMQFDVWQADRGGTDGDSVVPLIGAPLTKSAAPGAQPDFV